MNKILLTATAAILTQLVSVNLAVSNAAPLCTPPPSGLVSWWKGENNALDSAGSNNGTLQGGTVFDDGVVSQAFAFNGSNSFVQIPSTAALQPSGPFSIETWVNYDQITGMNGGTIVMKGPNDEVPGDWALTVSPIHKLRPHVNLNGGWYYFDCNTTLLPGTWYHVALVYDGSAIKGYVNGVLDGSFSVSGTVRVSNNPMKIGAYASTYPPAYTSFFDGRVDELSLYNRALTDSELLSVYNAGTAGKCDVQPPPPPPSVTNDMLAYYPFNGNANDESGHGNDGTVAGATLTADRFGHPNSAYAFAGNPSSKILINHTNLMLQPPFSCSLWVNWSGGTENPRFISVGAWEVGLFWPGAYRPINFNDATTSGLYDVPSVGDFTQNTWHHIVAVRSTNAMMIYVDGQLQNTVAVTAPLLYPTSFSWIPTLGHNCDVSSPYDSFAGAIDDIRIYNRALSSPNVTTLYALESTPPPPPPSSTNCVAAPTGIVGFWKAEGNALDSADSDNGSLQGGVSFNSGVVSQAFAFNGSNSFVQIPSTAALQPSGPFSIETWVNYDQITGMNGGTIVMKGPNDEVPGDWALTVSPIHKLRPHVNLNGGWYYFDCNTTLLPGTWYHVALVYDGSSIKGYVNGVLDGSFSVSGTVRVSNNPMKIGAYASTYPPAYTSFFDGRVDELSLYNRALTDSELLSIYNAGTAGKCDVQPPPPPSSTNCVAAPSGIIGFWKGENNALDSAGSNNGTLQGGTVFDNGVVNQAFAFNGSNSFVQIPSTADLQPSGPFSIETWVNYDQLTGMNGGTVVMKGPDNEEPGDWAISISAIHKLRPHVNLNGGWYYFDCNTTLLPGTWYHVALVYDGSAIKGYVNGVLDGSFNVSGTVRTSSNPMKIGAYASTYPPAYTSFFDGRVDELSLYNRALTDSELLSIYNAGTAGKCDVQPPPPPINHPPIADASATKTVVISANGSNAVVALDGSRSSDPDDDSLDYMWFAAGTSNILATGVNAAAVLPMGSNPVTLVVNDGVATDSQTISIEVISVTEAIQRLIATVKSSHITKPTPYLSILNAALSAAERGNFKSAANMMHAFEQQVSARIAPVDPALASALIQSAQEIEDALSALSSASANSKKALRGRRH